MKDKSFFAEITPRRKPDYLDKLFLSKSAVSDPLNGCPTEFHMYIPIPTSKYPDPNVQLWIKNGAGKVHIRFNSPVELADTLRKLADIITTDMALDRFQYAEDMAEYV